MSIQLKVGSFLGIILLLAFGVATWITTSQTVGILSDSSEISLKALEHAGYERSRNVFASLEMGARGSLERGQMELFNAELREMGKMPGVEEIGLTDSHGKIVYSSIQQNINKPMDAQSFKGTVALNEKTLEKEMGESLMLAKAHLMRGDCLRCHTQSKTGDLSGVLYVRYSISDLYQAREGMKEAMSAATSKSIMTGLATGFGGLLVACAGVYWLLGSLIRRPLERLREVMKEMSRGHLGNRLNMQQQDEIGETARAMDEFADGLETEMVEVLQRLSQGDLTFTAVPKDDQDVVRGSLKKLDEDLNNIISQISLAADQIAGGAAQVNDSSQSLSQGATEQASSMEQITASMNEMSSQTAQNAGNAGQANQLSSQVKDEAEEGQMQMQIMVQSMAEINQSSQNISKIIKTIDEIAFQTNLLALNAAVEAARAGQHGKGFAVVAEEVRTLAARSAKAAEETTALIEDSVNKAEKGAGIADKTEEALGKIMGGITKVADLVAEIATASNEQAQGITQVNQGLTQMDQVTQQNTANAEQSAAAAEELSSQAAQLKEMMAHFSLKGMTQFEGTLALPGTASEEQVASLE